MVQYAGACALFMLRFHVHYEEQYVVKFFPSKRAYVVGYHGTETPTKEGEASQTTRLPR
jgi:hypothetical protein